MAIIVLVYVADKYEKEPFSMIAKAYVLGMISVFLVLLVRKLPLGSTTHPTSLISMVYQTFFVAGTIEEIAKFTVFFLFIYASPHINEPVDMMVYLALVGLGFAVFENVQYMLTFSLPVYFAEGESAYHRMLYYVAAIRSIPGHTTFDALAGFVIASARFPRGVSILEEDATVIKPSNTRTAMIFVAGVLLAIILHGLGNLLLYLGLVGLFYGYMAFLIGMTVLLFHRRTGQSPFKEKFWWRLPKKLHSQFIKQKKYKEGFFYMLLLSIPIAWAVLGILFWISSQL
jgi:RsiW-degrading membrane proteinase PrsW (M82 family)